MAASLTGGSSSSSLSIFSSAFWESPDVHRKIVLISCIAVGGAMLAHLMHDRYTLQKIEDRRRRHTDFRGVQYLALNTDDYIPEVDSESMIETITKKTPLLIPSALKAKAYGPHRDLAQGLSDRILVGRTVVFEPGSIPDAIQKAHPVKDEFLAGLTVGTPLRELGDFIACVNCIRGRVQVSLYGSSSSEAESSADSGAASGAASSSSGGSDGNAEELLQEKEDAAEASTEKRDDEATNTFDVEAQGMLPMLTNQQYSVKCLDDDTAFEIMFFQ